MGSEDDLDAARALDLLAGRRREELHQPELPLRVQMSFRLFHHQQRETLWSLPSRRSSQAMNRRLFDPSPYLPLPVPGPGSSRSSSRRSRI